MNTSFDKDNHRNQNFQKISRIYLEKIAHKTEEHFLNKKCLHLQLHKNNNYLIEYNATTFRDFGVGLPGVEPLVAQPNLVRSKIHGAGTHVRTWKKEVRIVSYCRMN